MSNTVYFTSDPHFGHRNQAARRGFEGPNTEEHDRYIVDIWNETVRPQDTLWILGDLGFRADLIAAALGRINCANLNLILGNHDTLSPSFYALHFRKVYGFVDYKGFWLSHAPVHPSNFHRARGNIHGHIHHVDQSLPDWRYINVNCDVQYRRYVPVAFPDIVQSTLTHHMLDRWEHEGETD